MNQTPNIVSLLPGTTEIVCALGLEHTLVGRSHECDYPPSVTDLPYCTEPKFEPDGTSYQIDQRVKALLQEGLSVYRVDAENLTRLKPDIILTQDHCEVCAAPLSEVQQAVQNYLDHEVDIISVSPTDLPGVMDSIQTIADALDASRRGTELMESMQNKFEEIRRETQLLPVRSLLCLEWLDPLMSAGNWIPELAEIAGGKVLGATAGEHSPFIDWKKIVKKDSDVIAVMPCGYSIDQTLQEIDELTSKPTWDTLSAVQNEEVYILEGNQYFNRPGPRLTDSACILFEILYPDKADQQFRGEGWIKLEDTINKKDAGTAQEYI